MSRIHKFNRLQDLPIVFAWLGGKNQSRKVRLVFDTGASMTQLTTVVVEKLGYSARDGVHIVSAYGPAGPMQTGFSLHIAKLTVLGRQFHMPLVASYDYDNFADANIHGLLGFDLIKEFHLEMDGPKGELVVYH